MFRRKKQPRRLTSTHAHIHTHNHTHNPTSTHTHPNTHTYINTHTNAHIRALGADALTQAEHVGAIAK